MTGETGHPTGSYTSSSNAGSLFNHASVSLSVDVEGERIVLTSARAIQPDEDTDPLADIQAHPGAFEDSDIVAEDDLPFTWTKLGLDKDEEQLDDVELVQAWVVDVPDQTHIAPLLKWLKQSGLDKDALSHLKRVRRQAALSTLLLDTTPEPPALPPEPALEAPYLFPVPRHPALTPTSLSLKNTFWPTVFCPRRKWEPEPWTRSRVRWASDAMRRLKRAYAQAVRDPRQTVELPVVAHVPVPYRDDGLSRPFFAFDTRASTGHPLRHAALDVIRQVADYRAQLPRTETETTKNGGQYLLTGLSVFITHEPCVMCTMALLHSRVKEGVNHRFGIAVWREDVDDWPRPLDGEVDV